jgi:AcrR family transcriptional regulator
VAPEDLTARARILEAAIEQFADVGSARATIRGIAAAAGVSSGLLRHHFGSKQALRQACDDRLTDLMRKLDADAADFLRLGGSSPAHIPASYGRYAARALSEGRAQALFDLMAGLAQRWIADADHARQDPAQTSPHDRAVVSTAQTMAIAVLHSQISAGLGVDIRSPEGELRLRRILVDLYAAPLISPEDATRIRAVLQPTNTERSPQTAHEG